MPTPTKPNINALRGGKGRGLDLDGLTAAHLEGATLAGADLTKVSMFMSSLAGVDLSGANLTGANISDADLTGANLTGANLIGANLIRTKLTGANLTGAKLYAANLNDAEGADLTDADLSAPMIGDAPPPAEVTYVGHGHKVTLRLPSWEHVSKHGVHVVPHEIRSTLASRIIQVGRAEVDILATGASIERDERRVARIERKAYAAENAHYTSASTLNAHLAHAGLTSHRYPDGELCDLLADWADSIEH
jgi:uncharacterized protein YjbI with pentapeptide repeats